MKIKTNMIANRTVSYVLVASLLTLFAVDPAFAQGIDKVNTFVENVLAVLRGISIAAVTIAVMVSGYKFIFKHADVAEVGKILGGGLLIGSATEITRFLLS
ncbi:TrbC/VirB2 family protein [Pseudomonas sp. LPH60]|uniref:TrbC/VirB2 family protein n=1 Tax=Pseudomonas sp. LPH60 TaxID=3065906 RepID=UPI00273AB386|nr:TrbC/VirB2 family protein [Pseudomonas sp. LPH60]MDP4573451.1 TrbC/VirB2 family protein [Pseudomonas sp. LPH60]